ncbi:MAG: DUF6658 family protein [Elainellaceae cyanobacterium]
MNRIKQILKSVRLNRVLGIFLAGTLLLLGTACNPQSPRVSGEGSYSENRGQQTELYKPTQEQKGGMNQHEDTVPQRDTSAAEAKAKRLVKNAKENVGQVNSPEEFVESFQEGEPIDERVKNFSKDVGESAEQAVENVTEGARKGAQNLKQNAQETAEQAAQKASEASEKASEKASEVVK